MFNNQFLFERPMSIRLDRTDKDPLARLPEGLKSIGMGLGAGGAPLHDVESMFCRIQIIRNKINFLIKFNILIDVCSQNNNYYILN